MIVDVHTHVMWYPDHRGEQNAREALEAKRVKLEMSGGRAHAQSLDLHSADSTPETHWDAAQAADRVIVFGLQARPVGVYVPNDLIADYVATHPEKLEGWASINPAEPDAIEELERCVENLGLRGLKVGPPYQHWDPRADRYHDFFAKVDRYELPVMVHQGTTFPSTARLEWSCPLQLEPLAMAFPSMRIIIAHLGHPWESDTVALVRKAPNVFTDISAVHYRPWRYWQAMVTAMEYGVTHKILLGSDFPSATIADVIAGLRDVNSVVAGTSLPRVPEDVQEAIIHRNWEGFFGADAWR